MEKRATNECAEDVHIRAARLTRWINVTTEHLVFERYPARVRTVSIEEPVPGTTDQRLEELLADPSPSAEDKLIAEESQTDQETEQIKLLNWLKDEMPSHLTPLQRFVVIQYYWAGLTDKEIAEFLTSQPELRNNLRAEPKKQNIKKTRHQALEKLRNRWEEWHSE
jgi:DNA-directed RNA polymerase specialized sigma24 family protein